MWFFSHIFCGSVAFCLLAFPQGLIPEAKLLKDKNKNTNMYLKLNGAVHKSLRESQCWNVLINIKVLIKMFLIPLPLGHTFCNWHTTSIPPSHPLGPCDYFWPMSCECVISGLKHFNCSLQRFCFCLFCFCISPLVQELAMLEMVASHSAWSHIECNEQDTEQDIPFLVSMAMIRE